MAKGGLIGFGVGLAAAGVGAVVGITADRLQRDRATAVRLGDTGDYEEQADLDLVVIATDGVPLHVEVDEPHDADGSMAGAPTVVLVHGYSLSLGSWVFQRRALRAAGYRVVLYDQRGHGRSEEGDLSSYTVGQLGRDLRSVLDQVVPEGPVALLGHSMGGMTVMAFAGQNREFVAERVIAVGLISTSAGGLDDVDWGLGQLGAVVRKVGPVVLARLAGQDALVTLALKAGKDVESFLVHHFSFGSHVPMALVRYVGDMIFATKMGVMGAFLTDLMVHDQVVSLSALDGVETLVIVGTEDKLTPPAHADIIVDALPGAEYVVIESAGHLAMMEYPELVDEQVLALLVRARRAEVTTQPRPRVRKRVTDVRARRRVRDRSGGRGRGSTKASTTASTKASSTAARTSSRTAASTPTVTRKSAASRRPSSSRGQVPGADATGKDGKAGTTRSRDRSDRDE